MECGAQLLHHRQCIRSEQICCRSLSSAGGLNALCHRGPWLWSLVVCKLHEEACQLAATGTSPIRPVYHHYLDVAMLGALVDLIKPMMQRLHIRWQGIMAAVSDFHQVIAGCKLATEAHNPAANALRSRHPQHSREVLCRVCDKLNESQANHSLKRQLEGVIHGQTCCPLANPVRKPCHDFVRQVTRQAPSQQSADQQLVLAEQRLKSGH